MDDVAREAGVSKSTVSLALNNKPGISVALKQNVLQAAANLGYRLAKPRPALRTATNLNIAIVHSEPDQRPIGNPEPTGLYLHYLNGIRDFAQTTNLNLTVLADYREGETHGLAFQLLNGERQHFDGYILMGWSARQGHRLVQQIVENRLPAVALSRSWPELSISTVSPHYGQQVNLAIEHLVGLGHRRIAFLGRSDGPRNDWYGLRLAAYQAAMRRLTGSFEDRFVITGPTGRAAVQTLLAEHKDVTAIFAVNDDFALEVIRGLHERGCRVPQDLSIIGQDDMASFLQPDLALTTVGFPHAEVGYLAASFLHQQIETPALAYGNLWVRTYLIERSSCAAPKSGD
jgi:DNA-binding LacI/PurR family transcriptional regulator